MVMQILNIVAGSLLASPQLKVWGLSKAVDQWEAALSRFREPIGVATLILGLLALVDRLGVWNAPIPAFGASFPQSIPAIVTGLLLAAELVGKYPALQSLAQPLREYGVWIGLLSMSVGIGSLLFGCFVPQFCRGGLF